MKRRTRGQRRRAGASGPAAGSGIEVDEEGGVVAEGVTRRAGTSRRHHAPLVRGRAQPRLKRAIDEGLVDAEAVAAVRRVPGVGALARPEEAKRVDPSRGLEAAYPAVLLRVESWHFLVEIDQARVGVAHEESRSPTPRVGHAEDGVEEGKLA